MLTEIRKYMPSFLLKLYQRRALDKNCEITQEEFIEASRELAEEIAYVKYRNDVLNDACQMLQRLIEKKELL